MTKRQLIQHIRNNIANTEFTPEAKKRYQKEINAGKWKIENAPIYKLSIKQIKERWTEYINVKQ